MKRNAVIFFLITLSIMVYSFAEPNQIIRRVVQEPYTKADSLRIQQIAEILPTLPEGFGEPCSNRDAWEKIASKPSFKEVISKAEKYLGRTFPDWNDSLYLQFSKIGIRPAGQKMMGDRSAWLAPLVWAECIENKGRFIPVIEMVIRELSQQKSWVLPAHDSGLTTFNGTGNTVDLGASGLAFEFAQALYMLGDKISTKTRALLVANLYTRIFNPVKQSLLTGKGHPRLARADNWNSVCLAGVCGAALAVIEDPTERAFYVRMAEKYAPNSISGFSDDGYCSEGLGYYNYGFGKYIYLREILWRATSGKIDLFKGEKMQRIGSFSANLEIMNGSYPYFADCRDETTASDWVLWYCSRNLGLGLEKYDSLSFGTPAGLVEGTMLSFPNSASLSQPKISHPFKKGIRTYFEISGILICRPQPGSSCNIGAAFKGGNNAENHNHNDVGSYAIVVGNQQIMGDAGGPYAYTNKTFSAERYTLYKSLGSFGHPVPRINEIEQAEGATSEAKVQLTRFSDSEDVYKIDIQSAYPEKSIKELTRTFMLDRARKGKVSVTDEFRFNKKMTFETAITTRSSITVLANQDIVLEKNGIRALVKINTFGKPFELSRTIIEEDSPAYTRIGIRLKEIISDGKIEVVYYPQD